MKPLNKTLPLLAVLLLAGMAAAQPGMAGGGHRPSGHGMDQAEALPGGGGALQRLLPVLRNLDLTDTQREEIREIVERAAGEIRAIRDPEANQGLREQLMQLLVSPAITSAQVETLLNSRLENMRLVNAVIAAAVVEIHGVLTPEQRSALAEMDMHQPGMHPGGMGHHH